MRPTERCRIWLARDGRGPVPMTTTAQCSRAASPPPICWSLRSRSRFVGCLALARSHGQIVAWHHSRATNDFRRARQQRCQGATSRYGSVTRLVTGKPKDRVGRSLHLHPLEIRSAVSREAAPESRRRSCTLDPPPDPRKGNGGVFIWSPPAAAQRLRRFDLSPLRAVRAPKRGRLSSQRQRGAGRCRRHALGCVLFSLASTIDWHGEHVIRGRDNRARSTHRRRRPREAY